MLNRQKVTKRLQKIFWIYLTNNFIISRLGEVKAGACDKRYKLIQITKDNCVRVGEFRDQDRIAEYQAKLVKNEIGYFAEMDGEAVGSIWGTLNREAEPLIARSYMQLMPNEAMIHDIVTGEAFRGMGVGPFMVGAFADILLNEYGAVRIIVDVNIRNRPSMRMMEKAGLQAKEQVLYISAFGTRLTQRVLKEF